MQESPAVSPGLSCMSPGGRHWHFALLQVIALLALDWLPAGAVVSVTV